MPRNNNVFIHRHHLLFSSIPLHQKHHYSPLLLLATTTTSCTRLIHTWYHLQSISSTRTIILQTVRIGPPLEAKHQFPTTPSNKDCTSPPKITTTITITITRAVPLFLLRFRNPILFKYRPGPQNIRGSNIYLASQARKRTTANQQTRQIAIHNEYAGR